LTRNLRRLPVLKLAPAGRSPPYKLAFMGFA
jgi:hypothetical protein